MCVVPQKSCKKFLGAFSWTFVSLESTVLQNMSRLSSAPFAMNFINLPLHHRLQVALQESTGCRLEPAVLMPGLVIQRDEVAGIDVMAKRSPGVVGDDSDINMRTQMKRTGWLQAKENNFAATSLSASNHRKRWHDGLSTIWQRGW